jgi:hypothetical protein
MADEWLSSLALAAALSTHARVGRDSMLGRLDTELLRMIVEKVNEVRVKPAPRLPRTEALLSIYFPLPPTPFRGMRG